MQPGKSVAVLGAGPIGLLVLMCAKAFGADQVVITDIRQSNLDFVSQHYKATTLHTRPDLKPAEVAALLQQAFTEGDVAHSAAAAATAAGQPSAVLRSPDIVIDCVGVQQTLEAAVRAVAPGGTVVLVGMGAEELQLPATLVTCKEIDLLGSFRWGLQGLLRRSSVEHRLFQFSGLTLLHVAVCNALPCNMRS